MDAANFTPPDLTLELLRTGIALADASAISGIQTGGDIHIDGDGQRWYDVTPLLDVREVSPECADLNRLALAWAVARHLVVQQPIKPYLLRVCKR